MRILMAAACPLPWPRGTPIRIHRMAEALVDRGHDVTVVTYPLGDSTTTRYRLVRVAPGSRMASGPGPTVKKLVHLDPLLCRELASMLRHEQFDVIHAHHYEGLITALFARAATPARAGIPLVYDAHTLLASELPQYRFALPARVLGFAGAVLDRRLPRRADHVVAVTNRMRSWFIESALIPDHRVSLIPNGVEHDFIGADDGVVEIDNGKDAAPAVRRIVFAGNLAEYQGVQLLLEAFARVRASFADVELVFITGSDPRLLQPGLDRLGLNGAVRTLGEDYAQLPARLAAADVLVNPRIDCDGLPQKLLNYMAAGRPIVSFAGSAALLEHERTGLVVQDGDVSAFAAAVVRLLHDAALGRRMGSAARGTVVAAHGWEHVAEHVTAVYESIHSQSS